MQPNEIDTTRHVQQCGNFDSNRLQTLHSRIALTAGRGDASSEVGLAAIDLQYPYLILCQISDCQTYVNTLTKINMLDPVEILMPETMCQQRGRGNKLYKSIKEKFNALNITPISRMHFNESTGMERVRTLCAQEYSTVELIVKQNNERSCFNRRYYALAATAALLKYVEYVQHVVYAPRSMRIEFQGSPNTTMIDIESAQSLELIVSQSKYSIVSLLGTMDRCLTPMGRRLLRASILQPSCDERLILDRQACVAELIANRSLCISIQVAARLEHLCLTSSAQQFHWTCDIFVSQPAVQRLFGTDRLLTLATKPLYVNDMQNAERNLNYVLLLKSSLDAIPELEAILATGTQPFFVKMRKVYVFLGLINNNFYRNAFIDVIDIMHYVLNLQNLGNLEFRVIKDKMLTLINTDARFVKGCASSSLERCFAIQPGLNELLDVARQIYCELISDMKKIVEQLAVKHRLPLTLEYNTNLGYHINSIIPRGSNIAMSELPAEFIQASHRVRKNRRSFAMTTMALLTLNKQCKKACEEIYVMSNTLLNMLLEDIRQHVGCLFQLSADVAELDLILSLAQISSNPEYVRPSFGTKLELINSLHPIMELFNRDLPVPNDVKASYAYNFHLITGPNMSGKSTYLKQIVLLQIMAQIGSYVPATKATFRIADRIFCRMSSRDDAELNASTYVLELSLSLSLEHYYSRLTFFSLTSLLKMPTAIACFQAVSHPSSTNHTQHYSFNCSNPTRTGIFSAAKELIIPNCMIMQLPIRLFQMKEVQYILQSVTPNSLVVLDELCRHTAVEEGSAIAWSIYEKLSLTSAYTFAATHFLHLTALSNMYHNIETHYFETKNAEPENKTKELHLIYTHKLMPGIGSTDHYGIALAEVCSLPKCVTTKAREYASRQSTQNNLGSFTSSRSWEKSCYDAVVQLRALLDDNNFTFANVINIMKQLDLSKQPKQQPAKHAQGPAQFTSVPQNSQASRKRQKCEDDRNLDAVPKNNLTIETNNNASLTELPNQTNKNDTVPEEMEYEPTQIVDRAIVVAHPADHDLKTDLRLTDNVIKSFSLPNANVADEETSIIFNPCPSFQLTKLPPLESFDSTTTEIKSLAQQSGSITDDPLFYVRTSFTATSQKTVTLSETDKENQSQGEASLTFATNSIATSSLISRISSQGYHDYCLSQKDFDISQSQSISSDLARITARVKEAAIFRQIEGSSFDEEEFLNSIQQVPLNFTPPNDEDVVMTST
ncbi:hypothetical protein DMN91_004544 [Ooceraea biroi]|uniref:MutS protein-like protein n=1 Tax=Ooceraea biroi TaxID=2015173 RepID=A0A3L8DPP7_OOCBI|nr:hypothetical protein DMN91_004544 [Ooceraea biroi]